MYNLIKSKNTHGEKILKFYSYLHLLIIIPDNLGQ